MQAALNIVFAFKADIGRLLFILVALTYGFVSWHNFLLAGGIEVLTAAYDDFQEEQLLCRWLPLKFKKHGYSVNRALGNLVPCQRSIVGLVRFLKHWRSVIGNEVLDEIMENPNMERTDTALDTTGRLPFWPRLATRRLLSLWDHRLFDGCCLGAGTGAHPVMDWLVGDTVDWDSFLLVNYKPTPARNYDEILTFLQEAGAEWWDSHDGLSAIMPSYIKPDAQLWEGMCCEFRKKLCEHQGRGTAYSRTPGYRELLFEFEATFVHVGRLVACNSMPCVLVMPAASISLSTLADAVCPKPKRQKRCPRITGCRFKYDNRVFQTISEFCRQQLLTSSQSPGRIRLNAAMKANQILGTDELILIHKKSQDIPFMDKAICDASRDLHGEPWACLRSDDKGKSKGLVAVEVHVLFRLSGLGPA